MIIIKSKKIIFMVIGLILFLLSLFLINEVNKINRNREFNGIVKEFKIKHNEFEVKDYIIGNDNTIIKAALIYYDKETDSYSNVAIITDKGTGFLNLASGEKDFSFADNEDITLHDSNAVSVPLFNTKLQKIVDFVITVADNEMGTDYKIESKARD